MAVFNMVDLTVKDVRATVEFYRRVGVDIPDEKVWESGGKAHHVEAELADGVVLGVNSRELTKGYDPSWDEANRTYLIFTVDSRDAVDTLFAELTQGGYHGHLQPIDAFWGSRYAVVDDPDGNHVGIMSPQDAEHGEAPGL